jgi:mono/diheme cytochrome c family protein
MAVSGYIAISLAGAATLHASGANEPGNKSAAADSAMVLHARRSSPLDLEVAGDLRGLPPGATRYLTRHDLLALPQVSYTVGDDSNFTGPTEVSGVPLDELAGRLAAKPESDLIVAICNDLYRANYPRSYIAAHHPLLVLKINGKPPSGWPEDSEDQRYDLGPYLISHPKFTPSFKILAHADEPQIPWGVVRIEFRDERQVFGAIEPHGPLANDRTVQAGFTIARQNCFRCHNAGDEGGRKSGVTWAVLSAMAADSPVPFKDYVRNPKSKSPGAKMPGNSLYDEKTLHALTIYFQTMWFSGRP